jgi:hypothetical protein
VRLFDTVQHHVHGPNAQHRRIKIKAVEHRLVEMFPQLRIAQHLRMPAP